MNVYGESAAHISVPTWMQDHFDIGFAILHHGLKEKGRADDEENYLGTLDQIRETGDDWLIRFFLDYKYNECCGLGITYEGLDVAVVELSIIHMALG